MKSFIVAVFIGVFMIVGCILYMKEVEDVSDKLKNLNEEVIVFLENDDFEGAKQAHGRVESFLEEKLIMLAATGNHEELDQMQIYLSQVCEYIEERQKGDALAFCESLDIMFKHLPKDYRLKAENIL